MNEPRQLRADLLSRWPFSEEELRRKAQVLNLNAEELATYDEIEDLDYLLTRA